MITKSVLVELITEAGGFVSTKDASLALMATLAALGERLQEEPRELIAASLPEELADLMRERAPDPSEELSELFDRVRLHEGVKIGFAVEHAQIVCRAVGELLSPESRMRLGRMVPAPFMALFQPPPAAESLLDQPSKATVDGRTLSNGRSGARHPVSESRPPGSTSRRA